MTPRVLFIGAGKDSWDIRGRQMAAALAARATTAPSTDDVQWAEVIVLVKRAIDQWGALVAASGRPVVWDVLDYWAQPADNTRAIADLTSQVTDLAHRCRVTRLIGATESMAQAIGGVYLPHHARPSITPTPPRAAVRVVAYEGTPKYLGAWRPALEQACARRGWLFTVNPTHLANADMLVALRDGAWDGAVCRQWKSGVKYVNAYVAGRPVLTQPSAAFDEIQPVGDTIASPDQLDVALDVLSGSGVRDRAYRLARERGGDYALATIAARYRRLLQDIVRRAA